MVKWNSSRIFIDKDKSWAGDVEAPGDLKPLCQPLGEKGLTRTKPPNQGDNIPRLEHLLQQQYERQGMRDFILQTVAPLVKATGEAWAQGQLQIFQEHILSEHLRRFLKTYIAQEETSKPARIILATLPGETHTLGLLMVEAMLASRSVAAINLGGEVPMDQVKNAVEQYHADTLGITFSAAYPYKHIRPHLIELRDLLPVDVAIWAGGKGFFACANYRQG